MDTQLHKHPSNATFMVAAPQYSVKPLSKAFTAILKLFTGKHLCQSLQVFSCEFCGISKNISFYRTALVAASVVNQLLKTMQKTKQ